MSNRDRQPTLKELSAAAKSAGECRVRFDVTAINKDGFRVVTKTFKPVSVEEARKGLGTLFDSMAVEELG